ncbi:transcriptional regulator [Aliidongia dinghuensis]|uniref:Transcriptional regulator n=1 Tax=Aliidongia dinghuensis TaxID=1867774 RepID=A0A8J2YQ89_9PROT|nr:LysR family transcriptional regulator [Aliidongia dinghuensis]GGF05907.1 transcriptional regulator [Aliidongia dinghuensis]
MTSEINRPRPSPRKPALTRDQLARALYGPALYYFAAVCETLSIRAAARQLNIASSAVNRQILQLEETIGGPLFERQGRTLRLLPMGEVLARHARMTLGDLEATAADMDAIQGLRRGLVRVASVESIASDLLPAVVAEFARRFPLIHVAVTVESSSRVTDLVARGDVEIGFTFNPPKQAHLSVAFARDLAIGAVVARDHPLAARPQLALADCLDYPLVLPAKGLSIRDALESAFAANGLAPRSFVEANLLRFMTSLALQGQFVAFQTRFGIARQLADGSLIFIPLAAAGLPADRLALVTRTDPTLRLAPAIFFDVSRQVLGELLPQA